MQWTVTLANLHRVTKRCLATFKFPDDPYDVTEKTFKRVAENIAFAAEHEAARRTSIKRQTNRRVIRLPDRTHA